jgi:hypothetical protein
MHLYTLPLLLLTLLTSTTASPTPTPHLTSRATTCNGHASLCDKSYGNVTFVGTHNSYAVGGEVADNQGWNVSRQLVSSWFAVSGFVGFGGDGGGCDGLTKGGLKDAS